MKKALLFTMLLGIVSLGFSQTIEVNEANETKLLELAELSKLAKLSELSSLSSLSELASLSDQATTVILPPFEMEVSDEMQVMLRDLTALSIEQADLGVKIVESLDLEQINLLVEQALDEVDDDRN